MPGPPPKPIEAKRRAGNPGKRPLPDVAKTAPLLAGSAGMPEPARPLRATGKAMWRRIWSSGAVWLAALADAETVLIVCEQIDERHALRQRVFKYGDRFDRIALRALEKQIMHGLSVLGLTPTDRSRLGVAEVKVESALAKLRRERDVEDAARDTGGIDLVEDGG